MEKFEDLWVAVGFWAIIGGGILIFLGAAWM